jgi:hypothetical protein
MSCPQGITIAVRAIADELAAHASANFSSNSSADFPPRLFDMTARDVPRFFFSFYGGRHIKLRGQNANVFDVTLLYLQFRVFGCPTVNVTAIKVPFQNSSLARVKLAE